VTKKDESNNTGVIRLRPSDNVAVKVHAVSLGTLIAAENVTALDAISFGHKIATHAIAKDEPVRKCAQVLGVATRDIAPGRHMHARSGKIVLGEAQNT
jgi:altronate hydrolase